MLFQYPSGYQDAKHIKLNIPLYIQSDIEHQEAESISGRIPDIQLKILRYIQLDTDYLNVGLISGRILDIQLDIRPNIKYSVKYPAISQISGRIHDTDTEFVIRSDSGYQEKNENMVYLHELSINPYIYLGSLVHLSGG